METWESILLGVVQGATEFLPVSSSGHLVITQTLLGLELPGIVFEIAVHAATLVSILLVYRARVGALLKGAVERDEDAWRYIGLIVVATVPAGLLGVLAKDQIEALFDDPYTPGIALLVTGAVLWSSRAALEGADQERPTWWAALLIGCAQALALVPGISRSGMTVVAALWLRLEAKEAAAFSFLMAIPAVGGAVVLQFADVAGTSIGLDTMVVAAGAVAAGVTGVLAIRTFVAMLARRSFYYFAPYCWVVGVAYLAFLTLR